MNVDPAHGAQDFHVQDSYAQDSSAQFSGAQKLGAMARQIADFFRPHPEEEAAAAIAEHINKFWSPRMRGDFLCAAQSGALTLDPLLARAAALIRPPKPA
jgi:formate dehydrogenase subunit delta